MTNNIKLATPLVLCAALLAGCAAFLAGCGDDDEVVSTLPPPEPPPAPVCAGSDMATSRLFLQQLATDRVIVKWQGAATELCLGTDMAALDTLVAATTTEGGHQEAVITGLNPATRYYYSVGAAATAPADQHFTTAPASGALPDDGNTRIWLVGDSGTGGDDEAEDHAGEAAAVFAGMKTYIAANGAEPVDLFLMLGDNAYEVGSDFNYQQAVFETYTDLLKTTVVWSTIGNHEMGGGEVDICNVVPTVACGGPKLKLGGVSTSADPNSWVAEVGNGEAPIRAPYLDIFTLPAAAEAGGVASGTEQYYSFDYGNVHVVSLDSQLTARDDGQRATMRQWLIDDLSANSLDWTVVIFHHPPYSKGSNHDSDDTENNIIDRPQWDMRNEFVPIFDSYGVDVVYGGHSHSYERSYYLHDHLGVSSTFTAAAHAELVDNDPAMPASGRPGEEYAQLSPTSGGVDDRVVYTVAGNSGKADHDSGVATEPAEWLRHAAHIEQPADTETPKRRGLPLLGSILLDASATALTARMIDDSGQVLDQFTITR